MDLSVQLDNTVQSGLLWSCTSGIQLGRLSSSASTLLRLALIPTTPGLLVIKKSIPINITRHGRMLKSSECPNPNAKIQSTHDSVIFIVLGDEEDTIYM